MQTCSIAEIQDLLKWHQKRLAMDDAITNMDELAQLFRHTPPRAIFGRRQQVEPTVGILRPEVIAQVSRFLRASQQA